MQGNEITAAAPEAAAAERHCPVCGGELPRHCSKYCCVKCSAIGRENERRQARPQQPERQGPILLGQVERLAEDIACICKELFDLRADIMPILHELLERVGKNEGQSKLLSKKAAAKYLDISVGTLRKLVHDRELPYARIGNRVRFKRTELANFIERKNRLYSPRRH